MLRVASPANPFGSSAEFTGGYKEFDAVMPFSIGDTGIELMTLNPAATSLNVSIKGSIATFDYPQTHHMMGIGDILTCGPHSYVIKRKLDHSKWILCDDFGNSVSDNSLAVTSIRKAADNLLSAFSLLRFTDLTFFNISIKFVCYKKSVTETYTSNLTVPTFTDDQYFNCTVYAPTDLKNECNSVQSGLGVPGVGYALSFSSSSGLIISGNTTVHGIELISTDSTGSLISVPSGTPSIINNIIHGSHDGISWTSSEVAHIVCNIIYRCSTDGIKLPFNITYLISNNVIVGCGSIGIAFQGGNPSYSGIVNCAIDCPTCISYTSSWPNNLVSDSSSISGRNNVTLRYVDASNHIYLLDMIDLVYHVDFYSYPSVGINNKPFHYFPADTVVTNMTVGANQPTPTLAYAVGPSGDLKAASNITISKNLMTFSVAQTNTAIAAGCLVSANSITYVLQRILSPTTFLVSTQMSGVVADVSSPTTLSSITYSHQTLQAVLKPGGTVDTNLSGQNLISKGMTVKIACCSGTEDSAFSTTNIDCTELMNITVFAPNKVGVDCIASMRHSGVWNASLYYLSSSTNPMTVNCDYIAFDGIQGVSTGVATILSFAQSSSPVISNSIFKGPGSGIATLDSNINGKFIVVNNLFYKMNVALNFAHQYYSFDQTSYAFIYNNTFVKCSTAAQLITYPNFSHTNNFVLRNNLVNQCVKAFYTNFNNPESILIEANVIDTSSINDFFGSFNTVGTPSYFRSVTKDDYRIKLKTSVDSMYCIPLYCDGDFAFSYDFKNQLRSGASWNKKWDAGCDNYIQDKQSIHYSVSSESSHIDTGGQNYSLSNSIITISGTVDSDVCVGDVITLLSHASVASSVFLAERGSNNIWRVCDNSGLPIPDNYGTVTYINRAYGSVAIAMSVAASATSSNLVSAMSAIEILCCNDAGSNDPGSVTIDSSWTTSATYAISIISPFLPTMCGRQHRHSAIPGTGFTMSSSGNNMLISANNVSVEGISFINSTSHYSVQVGDSTHQPSNVSISYCMMSGGTSGVLDYANGSAINIVGNILHNCNINIHTANVINNTVVTSASGIICLNSAAVTINNISIVSTPGGAFTFGTIHYNNISSDLTGDIKQCLISFRNPTMYDYHLNQSDLVPFNSGYDFSSLLIPYEYDIDGTQTGSLISIGAHSPYRDTLRLVLSFGDSADIKNAGSVSISSGIATFSPSVPNPIGSASITAGDVVSYGSSSCYLYQRISDLVWIVKTITGGAPADTDGKLSVHSIKKAFSSPSTLSSDIQNSLGSLLLTHYNPIVDLTKAKLQIDIAFSQSTTVLSSPVTMSSFICDAVNFVRLYTPNDIVNECYVSQGHGGIYYHTNLSVGTGSFVALTSTGINFLTIDGLTIHKADDSNTLINIASGANCRVVNNILDGGATSINVPSTTLVMNNESLHAATNGILCGSNCNILNNTIVSAGLGVNNASTSSLVENNIFQSCTTWITNTANAYNNTYSNSDSSPINNNLSASTTFKNPSGGDYSPNKTDSAVLGNAISIPGHMTDARGKTRGRNWDRGALEYTPNIVFFSVGKKYYDGINKGVGVDSDIDIINGIAIFKNPQTSKYICCGDQVSFGIGGSPSYVYLKEKIDSNRWYVTTVNGTIPGDILGGHLTYIDRSYNSFSDAFLVLNQNLVTNNIQINLACCEFNDSTVSATLNANTDLDHYFRIFTANSAKECNESFRHKGLLDTNYFMFNFFNGVVISISSPFTELEGLQVYDTAAYCFEIATYNCYISKNIFVGTGVAISSVSPTSGYISNFVSADNIIINNLIYQSAWDGIKISSASVLNHYNVFLANNTIYECNGHGIKIIKSASNTDCTCSVINNIIQNSGYSDVSIDNNQYDLINNITSDDTSLTFPNYIVQFQNLPSLNFQLDRIKEKRAIKNAIDLSSYAIFTDDIIGTNRASGLWDIGAFQLSDIVSTSASLRFGPFRLKLQHASITKNIPFVILNLVHSGADSVSKFSSIHDMNTVLATNFSDFNVIIYVQKTSSGQSFLSQDAFQFGSIGSPIGTVVVMSNPLDTNVENLPSKIEFTGNFAGDAQDHSNSSIKIDQLHIAMHGYAMLGSSYLLGSLTIEDSIIETSNASLSDPVGTVINVINSDVDYHGSQTNVYLGSYTGTANNIMINSVILSNCGSALTFGITNKSTVVTDQIINCLTFNNGNAIIPNSNLYPDNIINCHWMVDPEFVGYIPKLTSPLVENGSDSVLKAPFFLTNSYTGAPRKINLHVDIGAYEAVIRSRFINASDIKNIYQKKIVYVNASTPYYATVGADRVFKDLYSDTGVSTVQGAEEIVRESSIIIELNDTQNDFVYISDKPFEVVRTFEAYYDIGTNTVVVKKQPSFDGKIFKNIFSVDEYIFYFDQAKHSLIVYMNDTFQKGVSGVGNPVNNVKIGGRPMLNGTI